MESQDLRKAVLGGDTASTSRVENGSEVAIEEMDTTSVVMEEDGDQMEEEPSSGLPVGPDSEERENEDNQHEEDSTPSSIHGRSRKSGVAKRQHTTGRSLTK